MGIAAIIGSPLAGFTADRLDRKQLLIGAPFARGITFIGLAVMAAVNAPFWTFVVLLFINSFLGVFFQNASDALITDIVPPELRVHAFSTVRVGLNIGWMSGPAIGAFLARTPFSLLFFITAVFCFAASAIALRSTRGIVIRKRRNDMQHVSRSFSAAIMRDRNMLLLLALSFVLFLTVSQFVSTLSLYATAVKHLDKTPLGLLYTINGAMVILFLVPINRLFRQVNMYLRIGIGAFLYLIAYIGFGLSGMWMHFAAAMMLMTVGEMLSVSCIVTAASYCAPDGMVGRYMGTMNLVRNVGYAVGPYIGSLLLAHYTGKPLTLWIILGSFAFIAGLGFLVFSQHAPSAQTRRM